MALPGCTSINAVMMAERLRMDVFSAPFRINGDAIRLSACFGVASSLGRSPVVVLREAEQALLVAKATGPESIQCAGDFPEPHAAPVAFLSPPPATNCWRGSATGSGRSQFSQIALMVRSRLGPA